MPRKRTPKQPSTDTETLATTPSATATIELPSSAESEQGQAVYEPPAAETPETSTQSFVERIEQERRKTIASDPFGIAGDYVAGVRLFESRQDRVMAIKFDEKPIPAVLEKLKDAGYRWNPRDKVWVYPVRPEAARTTRIDAERLYQEVRGLIRQDKGIESGQEIPF